MQFVTRAQWGARMPRGVTHVEAGNRQGKLAHYSTGQELGRTDTAAWVREIQRHHMDVNGWDDVGYNFLYDVYGNVFEGRGWDAVGAHAAGHNTANWGFCFLGNDDPGVSDLTPAAMDALRWLSEEADRRAGRTLPLGGHRDVNQTACPGDELYDWAVVRGMPREGGPVPPLPPVIPPPPPPPPGHPPWPGELLLRGSRGPNVQAYQARMIERGWDLGPAGADGDFGPRTEEVTRAFQQEKGLTVDGVVGPQTWDAAWAAPVTQGALVPPFPGLMRRGSHGDGVRALQQRLADRGWNIGVDGEFGRATDTIVRAFQQEKGLQVDGIVGPQTWEALWTAPVTGGASTQPPPAPPVPAPPPAPPAPHGDPGGQIRAWGFDGNVGANPVREFQVAFAFWDLGVDGVIGPKTAEAVQKAVDEGGRLSPHFAIGELACKHCQRILYHRAELRRLEAARERHGPIGVVSGYRCPAHNAAVGGAPAGQHPRGTACDFRLLLALAEQVGFAGIGTCGNEALHGDSRDAVGAGSARWPYC